jgi:hypothetical protein
VVQTKKNRKFARYIKSKTKAQSTIGPLLTSDKKIITDDKEMAEELNNYFSSVFTQETGHDVPEAEEEEIMTEMTGVTITRDRITEKIKELRKESEPGPDGISPRLLKELGASILEPLEIIFNQSMREGAVPDEWKTATVTPIFKKGTKGNPGNYRPVSLTSVPCKILESMIKDSLMSHLLSNNLIKSSQHGFVPGKSCASNLVEFMDKVTKLVDEGSAVDIFYLDFAKGLLQSTKETTHPEAEGQRNRSTDCEVD